jgi:hypothetical protein
MSHEFEDNLKNADKHYGLMQSGGKSIAKFSSDLVIVSPRRRMSKRSCPNYFILHGPLTEIA